MQFYVLGFHFIQCTVFFRIKNTGVYQQREHQANLAGCKEEARIHGVEAHRQTYAQHADNAKAQHIGRIHEQPENGVAVKTQQQGRGDGAKCKPGNHRRVQSARKIGAPCHRYDRVGKQIHVGGHHIVATLGDIQQIGQQQHPVDGHDVHARRKIYGPTDDDIKNRKRHNRPVELDQ